ncbi:Bug family tripartite tricarboxylate transporter substrate binding protein [Rhodoplanes sp. Z2-YC6860]|uniref:Bug family tripartite tricarboxylate transporter substrate binding protein n=1 Tax=Rhodoplanes sp. Z2-YC6860 TaxID=674703 RepID=UPI00078CEB26|nr:tripartite tricarboxylate transporter substrate binding protein [Rhodoplanes sp. Z2-YC6860]AMN41595.1 extra-cytoplasmic solute receptor [Rhodoplanes sp. Z2-YC6860]
MKLSRSAIGLAVVAMLGQTPAFADDYPSRPIKIIAPIAAGGPSDTAARLVAQTLSRHLGQSIVVENRTGAGGVVGTEIAASAPPDGYTLLLSIAATFTVIPLSKKVGYDPENDFIALGQIWQAPQALVVRANSPFNSAADLVSYAKANPGKLTFGSAGIGTTTHLSIELLKRDADIDVTHVPYRGTSQSVADIMGGTIDAAFGDVSNVSPFVEGGKLKALATTGTERSALMPDVPTTTEAGIPGVRTVNWYGLHVQAKAPREIQDKLKAAVLATQNDPGFKAALTKNATSTGTVGAEAFDRMIREERQRLAPVIRSLGQIQ